MAPTVVIRASAQATDAPELSPAALSELAKLQDLYEQAPCGYLTTTDDGVITAVNTTFLNWTGFSRVELLGTRLRKLMPIGDQILYSTHCGPLLVMIGAVAEIAIEIIGADGQRRAALLSAARTPATEDIPASVRVIIFSAHERRSYEKELVASRRHAEESDTRRVSAEADLLHFTVHDEVTGLRNRTGLSVDLRHAVARQQSGAGSASVLLVNLDHFKAVNDSLGISAGDDLLRIVAHRLLSTADADADVARISADEFVVLSPGSDAGEAMRLADRVLAALHAPVVLEGLEILASASIGIALTSRAADSADSVLRHASIAMYQAKARGRNRWVMHDSDASNGTVDRLRLLGELRAGISRGELRVHHQPRIDLRTGGLSGVEALVRWQHPTRGLLPPSDFIELAEETGLIRELGEWVLDDAVAQAVRWRHAMPGSPPIEMAVNLSTRQLADPGLLDMVAGVLDRHGLQPSLLTLEITETAIIEDPETARTALLGLHLLGVKLSVDDFGTGYAGLTYLKQFPIDELKIDRSFVSGLNSDPHDLAIVTSCIQLAHAIGVHAVAEGVETAEQGETLRELGCDLAQGYHYSRPLAPEQFLAWQQERLL